MIGAPSSHASERIVITGGTGFVGSALRAALAGRKLRLIDRDPARFPRLATDDIELVRGDVVDPASLHGVFDGSSAVIHLVAIIEEAGGETFDRVIRQGTVNVVAEAKRAGVGRVLQMSALGAMNDPRYAYFIAKWRAEEAVKSAGIPWTIFRPSIVFGPGDGFITVLADLVRKAPIVPVVGSGQSKFQPIAVEEVADAFVHALDDPAAIGQTYELGGPEILTYEQLLDTIAAKLGKRKRKIHIPVGLMKPIVSLSQPLPKALRPPVTPEQLNMLAVDNCTDDSATARLIGRPPTRLADGIDYIVSSR